MRNLSRASSAPREVEQSDSKSLKFRKIALLYPAKDILERIRRDGGRDADSVNDIEPMFDEDRHRPSPLARDEEVRVIVAQDDNGVSLNRLLFDSRLATKDRSVASDATRPTAKILSFARPASRTGSAQRSSGGGTRQVPKDSGNRLAPVQSTTSSSSSGFFGHSNQIRRMPPYVSLADARNDPHMPIEDTKDEMDSWLDCVFGKGQMRYKGENTKVHVLQRQPVDPKLAHWERESQRGGFELVPQRNAPLPKSRPDELVKLRRPALLISRTFTVPIHDVHLPDQPRHNVTRLPSSSPSKSDGSLKQKPHRVHCTAPTFGVAIVLPLEKSHDDGTSSTTENPIQIVVDKWHMIARALDALEASAVLHIRRQLNVEVDAMVKRFNDGLATSLHTLKLKSGALQGSASLCDIAGSVSARITRTFHVVDVSARSEWNIWRDEIRECSRSGKGSDAAMVAFIQLSLTAALSSSLNWMRVFAPPQLQTRLQSEARAQESAYDEAQNRTVITTTDHNTARQIVFILSKFMPGTPPPTQFGRSPANATKSGRVSALTQGLKAVGQKPRSQKSGDQVARPTDVSYGVPVFDPPLQASPSSSPLKHCNELLVPRARSSSKGSLQQMKSRIDIQAKGTPAMPIASAPGSSYVTPAASPEGRPGSSASAQGDLLRHLQRNNSALSETSTESGSFWSSLRSSSWNWTARRGSAATSASEGGVGNSGSQRGETPTSILKTAKTSLGRGSGKKLVRMVEEAEDLHAYHSAAGSRVDSAIPTPTIQSRQAPPALSRGLEYVYNASEGVVDVQQPDSKPDTRRSKVPASGYNFPDTRNDRVQTSHQQDRECTNATYDKVAGYLDRVHPDFALQAVKPYRTLECDIRACMQAERSPRHGCDVVEPHFFPLEHWVEVCSTILIDADAMTVRRLTLRRRIQYSLNTQDEVADTRVPDNTAHTIRITKSDEMETVKRTYRRNDAGNKIDWKDKRIVPLDSGNSSGSGGESSHVHATTGSSGATIKHSVSSGRPITKSLHSPEKEQCLHNGPIGDDLSAFIDSNAKVNHRPAKHSTINGATQRVAIRNAEGKISGWRDTSHAEPEEAGLRDLPASFIHQKRDRVRPVVHECILDEVFDEEIIHKPDQSIVHLMEQLLASNDTRSTAPSRAGSVHERTHSRSNSLCGSGLTELQHESKKLIEDALEGLVTSLISDKHSSSRPPGGGFLGFRRGGQGSPEGSLLRQAVSKWLNEA